MIWRWLYRKSAFLLIYSLLFPQIYLFFFKRQSYFLILKSHRFTISRHWRRTDTGCCQVRVLSCFITCLYSNCYLVLCNYVSRFVFSEPDSSVLFACCPLIGYCLPVCCRYYICFEFRSNLYHSVIVKMFMQIHETGIGQS